MTYTLLNQVMGQVGQTFRFVPRGNPFPGTIRRVRPTCPTGARGAAIATSTADFSAEVVAASSRELPIIWPPKPVAPQRLSGLGHFPGQFR